MRIKPVIYPKIHLSASGFCSIEDNPGFERQIICKILMKVFKKSNSVFVKPSTGWLVKMLGELTTNSVRGQSLDGCKEVLSAAR